MFRKLNEFRLEINFYYELVQLFEDYLY